MQHRHGAPVKALRKCDPADLFLARSNLIRI